MGGRFNDTRYILITAFYSNGFSDYQRALATLVDISQSWLPINRLGYKRGIESSKVKLHVLQHQ